MHDSFDRLAAALEPERTPTPPPMRTQTRKKRARRREPDRSRDHAIYAAPHRPPARSVPIFEKDVDTVRRRVAPPPSRRGPPRAALAAAAVAAVISFGVALFATLSP